jgi:serine/threonine protein phosphatase PrpC
MSSRRRSAQAKRRLTHLAGRQLADGDQILICTDGLTDMVPEPMIADVLRCPGRSAASDCQLVNLALSVAQGQCHRGNWPLSD